MKKTKTPSDEAAALRRHAEARLQDRKGPARTAEAASTERILHELEVHEIELEIQNEELRAARLDTETSLERYRELFDFAPIGYATLGPDEAIREVNHAGARILGRDRSRLVGARFKVFVARADLEAFGVFLATVRNGDAGDQSCEVALTNSSDERSVTVHVRVTGTTVAPGQPSVLLAFTDITERKAREEVLRRIDSALREAHRRKDEFLAALSHELRNPLGTIHNSFVVLTKAQPGSEQASRAQAIIDRQLTHLRRLVDDLLDVARIMRGKVQLQREIIELGDLVRRAMEDHRPGFDGSGIELEGHFDPGLFWVNADPARIGQILSNILANAEKFTNRGGRVVVSLRREDQNVALCVQDTGVGIPPDVMEHLFEPFAQASQTMDRSRGGLGLGLAATKGFVELHGGTIVITSDGPGRGTEVVINLPLEAAPAKVAAAAESAPARSRRVLVVEDSPDAAESLRDVLAFSGHEVEVAYDGPAALERARGFRPEIVICDIGLPGMDGYDVARAFRAVAELQGAYLVALSGYAQPEHLQRAVAAGFDQHLVKPLRVEELDRLLAEAPGRPDDDGGGERPALH